jgi:uracil-DNA glycosylase family protein
MKARGVGMPTTESYLPARMNLTSLRRAAAVCKGCELYKNATQTVLGAGPRSARLIMVGEMPGDGEDRAGKPFVGPAGRLLSEACAEARLERNDVYVTNAVKHFRWQPRGKRRLHKSPAARHIEACKPWLQAEILVVEPQLIVCLGAVAAKALLGSSFRVTRERGKLKHTLEGLPALATYHPAAILRTPDSDARRRMRDELISDLTRAVEHLEH